MLEEDTLFKELEAIGTPPAPFSRSTRESLWTDPHISRMMLATHLDPTTDRASRRPQFVDDSAAWIAGTLGLEAGRRLLDLGCGPGLYTNRLARTGASVTGIDLSARSIGHAREVAARDGIVVDYEVGDYHEHFPLGRFDVVTMIHCDYCAIGPEQRAVLLRRVADHLAPGGRFLFDVHALADFDAVAEDATFARSLMDGFWSANPYFGFHHRFRYEAERVSLDRYDIVERDRRRTFYNWLQYFDPETLRAELAAAGLRAEVILGDVAGRPYDHHEPEFAVLAGAQRERRRDG